MKQQPQTSQTRPAISLYTAPQLYLHYPHIPPSQAKQSIATGTRTLHPIICNHRHTDPPRPHHPSNEIQNSEASLSKDPQCQNAYDCQHNATGDAIGLLSMIFNPSVGRPISNFDLLLSERWVLVDGGEDWRACGAVQCSE